MIVIEASAVVDALIGEAADPQLLAFIANQELHAPALLDYEVASALRGLLLGNRLSHERLGDAVGDFGELQIQRYPLAPMIRAVLALHENFTVYDAAYVVLADALDVPLVTADEKLGEARRLGVDVHVVRPFE